MIEVEKNFQPTEEQLKAMLLNAEFIENKSIRDVYYDFDNLKLLKDSIKLRNRNGSFELKIGKPGGVDQEIENKEEIENYFNTDNLDQFIKDNLIEIINYNIDRKKYKKGDFNIDIDETDFGYKICEIECLIEKEEDIKITKEKIYNLAREYNWEIKKIPGKRAEYLRLLKPDIYKEIYGEKLIKNKELKMK